MDEERRDSWKVAAVLHAGEGPLKAKAEICGVYSITAAEAAECYVEERMEHDTVEGDPHHVAVEIANGDWRLFEFRTKIDVRLTLFSAGEYKPL